MVKKAAHADQPNVQSPLVIAGQSILPGQRRTVELPVADLYTHARLTMPVHVIRGQRAGPVLFVSAAVHGDELNGIEIIRRLLGLPDLDQLHGTLLAVPIVNVHGFLRHSRYLPDRRDLNRNFPGSELGSIAARLAHVLTQEVVKKSHFGIDLHTGAINRPNLPQIRADLSDVQTLSLAKAFGCSLLINSKALPGSLREFSQLAGMPFLVYEAGEALRFNESAIRAGVQGITQVMRALEMLAFKGQQPTSAKPLVAYESRWVRAPESGIFRSVVDLGATVKKGQVLGYIGDPFGPFDVAVRAVHVGVVIGQSNLPLAHAGEALFHVAKLQDAGD